MAQQATTASTQDTFMDRLRVTTAQAHAATEEIPFNAGILARTLPQDRFAAQVKAWAGLHAAIESAIDRQTDPGIQKVWGLTGPRADLLEDDLTYLGMPYESAVADQVVQDFGQWIDSLAQTNPMALLGVLYVFEGSQLGGTILKKPLSDMYGLQEGGLSYYNVHGPEIRKHWTAFREGMNEVVGPDQEASLIAASNQTFDMVGRLLECLSHDLAAQST